MPFELEYPRSGGPLFPNRRAISGWCFTPTGPLDSIVLRINGRRVARGVLGQRRPDIAQLYPDAGDLALFSGFRADFEPSALIVGENAIELEVSADGRTWTEQRAVSVTDEQTPCLVLDVFIDIVGHCNLRCAMCPQGLSSAGERTLPRGLMSPALLIRILAELRRQECLPEYVNLYNWGDPLLHPELARMLEVCAEFGRRAILSSNLSVPAARLLPLVTHDVELLLVSVSGFTQTIYELNHSGGSIDQVRANLLKLKNGSRVKSIVVKYLAFSCNAHEIEPMRRFCEMNGLEFGVYQGTYPSAESFFQYLREPAYRRVADTLVAFDAMAREASRSCPQEMSITIDHLGHLQLCCVSWAQKGRGNVLTSDLREHLTNKVHNEFCQRCLRSGYSYHKHFGVMR